MTTTKGEPQTDSIKGTSKRPVRIGLLGYGYWGPNLARNVIEVPGADLVCLIEKDPSRLQLARKRYPWLHVGDNPTSLFQDETIDAVILATPMSTHFALAKEALEAGKHVLVTKPIAASVREAEELISLAERSKRVLMVDHTFIYTHAVRKMKEIVKEGTLGNIYYFDSVRINLGLFQQDLNVVWDLAPHDLSILAFVLEKTPLSLVATGAVHSNNQIENMAYISMELEGNILAHIHVNWLAPVKVRRTIIGGSKKMLIYDDLEPDEKIKIYDRGVDISNTNKRGIYKTLIEYRMGDMYAPTIEKTEALAQECEHFIQCIQEGTRPITDGYEGLKMVRILEAIEMSLRKGGQRIKL